MQFEKGLLPRSYGWREVGAAVLVMILLLCGGVAWLMGWSQAALASLQPAPPTPSIAPPTLTPTPSATAFSQPLPPTMVALVSPTPTLTPTDIPPPEPTATWFYIIPAQPTPIPTPYLPPAAPFPTSCEGPGRMNIMVVGIDGFNTDYYRAARSDTLMLLGINVAAKSANMLSIPRDLWVQLPNLPEVPEARINTAYHYGELYGVPGGGPAELSATLANTFGVRVDRHIIVSFDAFIQGVDSIGGIDLNIPTAIHDDKYPLRDGSGTIAIDFPEGWGHMDGATALIYARIRHDSNDFNRMRRQQQVLFAIRDKLLSPEAIPQWPALAQVLFYAVRTDLSFEDIALLGCLGPQINTSAIQTWVIDSRMVTSTKLESGAQVLLPNMDAIRPVLESFNVGE